MVLWSALVVSWLSDHQRCIVMNILEYFWKFMKKESQLELFDQEGLIGGRINENYSPFPNILMTKWNALPLFLANLDPKLLYWHGITTSETKVGNTKDWIQD